MLSRPPLSAVELSPSDTVASVVHPSSRLVQRCGRLLCETPLVRRNGIAAIGGLSGTSWRDEREESLSGRVAAYLRRSDRYEECGVQSTVEVSARRNNPASSKQEVSAYSLARR